MTGYGCIVREDTVITDHRVVTHVHVRHEQIVIADAGLTAILNRPTMQRHAFANRVVAPDHEGRRLAVVCERRRTLPYGGEWIDARARANLRRTAQDHVRVDDAVIADLHCRPDDGPGADRDPLSQPGAWVDYRACVDVHAERSLTPRADALRT